MIDAHGEGSSKEHGSSKRNEIGFLLNREGCSRINEGTLIESEHFFKHRAQTAAFSSHHVKFLPVRAW